MIRIAKPGETMVVGDTYIFRFELPEMFTRTYWTTPEASEFLSDLNSAVQAKVQELGHQFVFGDHGSPRYPRRYSVTLVAQKADATDTVFAALLTVIQSKLSEKGYAGTPVAEAGGNWVPLMVGLAILGGLYFLGRSY